jgi:hypothetical protein
MVIILKSPATRGGWIVIDLAGRTALALAPPGGNWLQIAALQNDHNGEASSRF